MGRFKHEAAAADPVRRVIYLTEDETDVYVAEDGGNMEICVITPDDRISVFLRITGHSGSEITGPAFTPAGNRLYFSSQRGTTGQSSGGITYCVTGPFRT